MRRLRYLYATPAAPMQSRAVMPMTMNLTLSRLRAMGCVRLVCLGARCELPSSGRRFRRGSLNGLVRLCRRALEDWLVRGGGTKSPAARRYFYVLLRVYATTSWPSPTP